MFSVCVSVYLPVLVPVSVFKHCLGLNFLVIYLENSFLDFDVNHDKFFAQKVQIHTDTQTHTDTHVHTTN